MPIVSAKGIYRVLGNKKVLSDISLDVGTGEVVAVLGANGSGKTTFLRILSGLLYPSAGEVHINGHSLVTQRKKAQACVSWVPAHEGGFFQRFTGLENLVFFGALMGLPQEQTLQRLGEFKSFAPLVEALTTPFYACSLGMRQSLNLGRGLIQGMPVLIMDEPTRGLDPDSSKFIWDFLKRRAGKQTIIFATNMPQEAEKMATRTVYLKNGILHE